MAAMSYLTTLAQRTLGSGLAIRPLLPTVYQRVRDDGRHPAPGRVLSDRVAPVLPTSVPATSVGQPTDIAPTMAAPTMPPAAQATTGPVPLLPDERIPSLPRSVLPARSVEVIMRDAAPSDQTATAPAAAGDSRAELVRSDPVRTVRPGAIQPARDAQGAAPHPAAPRTRDQARASESASRQERTPPDTVHVHIGRIDVRAAPAPAGTGAGAPRPAMKRTSLADYLSAGSGGSGGQP